MSSDDKSLVGGPISWMARNSVAANLVMIVIILAGIVGYMRTKQEVFPQFSLDVINVTVVYPGASPAEVEQSVVLAVEEAVQGIDGVKRVNAVAAESAGNISVELLLDADPDKVLADVKAEVDRIQSFPEEAEKPQVQLVSPRSRVIDLVISGDTDRQTLHRIAERARADMIAMPGVEPPGMSSIPPVRLLQTLGAKLVGEPIVGHGVTQIDIQGLPPLEVSVEIPQETLESYGLSLDMVARQIAAQSVELPGGGVKTDGGELLVRVSDRKKSGYDFEDIILRGTSTGAEVRLGDIATVTDAFADADLYTFYNGNPAVRLVVYRVGNESPIGISTVVRTYMRQLEGDLPDNVTLSLWDDDSEMLEQRMDLLYRNGRLGIFLVFLVLALFLDLRLAGWVSVGIAVSFAGSMALNPIIGNSLNMVTLFALIVTIGIVVDDAIIVGENAYDKMSQGIDPTRAAIEGAQEMAVPVTFSVLTTMTAFLPLMFVPGIMGKFFGLIPSVVIAVLAFSLIESFFVLPAHLAHTRTGEPRGVFAIIARAQRGMSARLDWFTQHVYKPALRFTLHQRYAAVAVGIALFFVAVGSLASGFVPFNFFPRLEGDVVTVSARLPYGSPVALTEKTGRELLAAGMKTVEDNGGQDIFIGSFLRVGEGGNRGFRGREAGGHIVTVELELVPTDDRDISAEAFSNAWSANTPDLPGVEALSFKSSSGPGSNSAVEVQLTHPDIETLAQASEDLALELRSYSDLINVMNDWTAGKPQIDYTLHPNAQSLGLTSFDIARQIRSAFYGAEAVREQRERNELKVMVRLPQEQRQSEYDLEEMKVRTPMGGFVPLSTVADYTRGRSPTTINRENGQKVVKVSADKAPHLKSSREIIGSINADVLPGLKAKYPGLEAEFVGSQREQSETMGALAMNYLLAMFVVFAMLAIPFKSYVQPAIIMSAIPFGFVGAVGGHLMMGYEMSVISFFGIVALSGVVVNDSLVLIDATNKYRDGGMDHFDAVMAGGTRRLRPILLTSLTTFFGLAPMILETSMQARFLVPMAISLGWGVLFATFVILLLVPALYMILEDVRWTAHLVYDWLYSDEDDQAPPSPPVEQAAAK